MNKGKFYTNTHAHAYIHSHFGSSLKCSMCSENLRSQPKAVYDPPLLIGNEYIYLPIVVSYLRSPSQLFQLARWHASNLPEHAICLKLTSHTRNITHPAQHMLVDAKFMPRAYLRRFRSLQELAVDMFDYETAEDTDLEDLVKEHGWLSMFYCVAPSALGSLLESGAFPKLVQLKVEVGGYHAGKPVTYVDDEDETDVDDATQDYMYFTWVHQLALSIVRSIRSGSTPSLCAFCLSDNFGLAYFDNILHPGSHLPRPLRQVGDQQTDIIRYELIQTLERSLPSLPSPN